MILDSRSPDRDMKAGPPEYEKQCNACVPSDIYDHSNTWFEWVNQEQPSIMATALQNVFLRAQMTYRFSTWTAWVNITFLCKKTDVAGIV
jgi:hypothetical protein